MNIAILGSIFQNQIHLKSQGQAHMNNYYSWLYVTYQICISSWSLINQFRIMSRKKQQQKKHLISSLSPLNNHNKSNTICNGDAL